MIAECNKIIKELVRSKLREDMGLLWWTSKRRKRIHDIVIILEELRKNPVLAKEQGYENLNIDELESFLIRLLQSYNTNTQDKTLNSYPDLRTPLDVNDRVVRIINFLKIKGNLIDMEVQDYLNNHKDIMFAKKMVYRMYQLMFAKDLAKNAGKIPPFITDKEYEETLKVGGSPVTTADKKIDAYVISHIKAIFPEDGILTEESAFVDITETKIDKNGKKIEEYLSESERERKLKIISNDRFNKRNVWIVDPLDGTKEFIKKEDGWSVIIAKAVNHRPVIGVQYFPKLDVLYYAKKGSGSFIQTRSGTKRMWVNHREKDLMGVAGTRIDEQIEFKNYLMSFPDVIGLIKAVGGGKLCKIAEGVGDFTAYNDPNPGIQEWDLCASDVILSEAGGILTDFNGNLIKYNFYKDPNIAINGLLASNGHIHKKLLENVGDVKK